MIDLGQDIRSLSDFKRNTSELVDRMQDSGHPMVLTVNGKAKLVVQDATAYQKLMDALDYAEAVAGIRSGLADVKAGRSQPARAAFAEIRAKRKIPTKVRA